jgi:hypothetical protein
LNELRYGLFKNNSSDPLYGLARQERHAVSGYSSLIEHSEQIPREPQTFGENFARVVYTDSEVGIDIETGLPTSVYTVITDIKDNLITAFPGLP